MGITTFDNLKMISLLRKIDAIITKNFEDHMIHFESEIFQGK